MVITSLIEYVFCSDWWWGVIYAIRKITICQYSNPKTAFKKYRARTLGIVITQ